MPRPCGAVLLAGALLLAAPSLRAAPPDPDRLRAAAAMPGSVAELPPAAALAEYFAAGPRTLDLFCAAERRCHPARQKRALYTLFFRGAFARPPLDSGNVTASDRTSNSTSNSNSDGRAIARAPVIALPAAAPQAPLDPDAAYAAQAAAYFTEPGYACRRPLTARVLESLWQLPPRADACPASLPFLVGGGEGRPELRQVTPARVAAVHLLFAGETGGSFSRFGHVGLRLLQCAPAREMVGGACAEDLDDHLALGFRAAVDEFGLSMWKGLSGGYRLRLFADPFMTVYDDYTVREFRSLSSLPLRLTAPERELLVRALAEVHWAYATDYRFFTQNCASELSWLLRVVSEVAGATPRWLEGGNVRPDRLFRRARAAPAFDAAVLADLRQAERDGFFFPASAAYFQRALDTVAERAEAAGARLPVRDFEAFRALDANTRRRQFHAPALEAAAASPADAAPHAAAARPYNRVAHAALVLESWIERRQRRELLALLAHYYVDLANALLARTDFFTPAEHERLARCLTGLAQPLALGGGSGVPAAPLLPDAGCAVESVAMQATLDKLFALAPPPQQAQIADLRATVATVDWLLPQTGLPFPSPSVPVDDSHDPIPAVPLPAAGPRARP